MSMNYLITSIVLVRFYYVMYVYICQFIVIVVVLVPIVLLLYLAALATNSMNTYLLTKS